MSDVTEDTASPSLRAQILALAPGESCARAVRFDSDTMVKTTIPSVLRSLRSGLQPTVHRLTQEYGRRYTIEGGEFRTSSFDLILCMVVTRLA